MSRTSWAALSFCLLLWGCQRAAPEPNRAWVQVGQPGKPAGQTEKAGNKQAASATPPGAVGEFVIEEPLRYGKLTIFPILSRESKNQDRFLTLREGLESEQVKILELGAAQLPSETANGTAGSAADSPATSNRNPAAVAEVQGDVNSLLVLNTSERPLYLLPGEIIVGGKQDRVIAQETIVPPSGKPQAVAVFCVEAGRWTRRGDGETAEVLSALSGEKSDGQRVKQLAERAKRGEFVVTAGNLGSFGRLTVQEGKGQGAVWAEVAKRNMESGAKTQSGAFTQNYVQADLSKKIDAYCERFERPIAKQQQIVGVMIAVNDVILWVDVFESTPLFRKLWPTLLRGFAVDAISLPHLKSERKCSVVDAKDAMLAAMESDVEKTAEQGGLEVTTRRNGDVVSFTAGGVGGFGGAVHGGGFF